MHAAGTLFWEWALDTLQERDGLTVLANDTTFTEIIVPAVRQAQTYASPSVPGCQRIAPRPTAPPVQVTHRSLIRSKGVAVGLSVQGFYLLPASGFLLTAPSVQLRW